MCFVRIGIVLLLTWATMSCAEDKGSGRNTLKWVPNEDPPVPMKNIPVTELVSEFEAPEIPKHWPGRPPAEEGLPPNEPKGEPGLPIPKDPPRATSDPMTDLRTLPQKERLDRLETFKEQVVLPPPGTP